MLVLELKIHVILLQHFVTCSEELQYSSLKK